MAREIVLRDYQLASIDGLRTGIRAGHRAQVLVAPTGGGKTVCAAHLLAEATARGSRSAFIVDRISLVDQTSAVLDSYGIPHGIIQSGHWRKRPCDPVQICSAQTIEKRGFLPGLDLLIVDEAHCMRSKTSEFVKNTNARVIGLTATPFSAGMADLYTNLVNVTTTNKLVADGFLVRPIMYAAKAVDMTGAKVVAGEWAEKEIESRGLKIVGDIVSEWIDKTNLHFGGPVKTIVFSATVDHGDELCRQFNGAGYNFQQISYKDGSDSYRRELIEEFRKADSSIHGLVSCEVFSKGFDVADILCLSEGSKVLTHRGLVAIENVLLSDRIWDGIEFVRHGGAVFKGEQDVIHYAGLSATAGHQVKTAEGWRSFGQCSSEQIPIVATGVGGLPVRESDGYFSGGFVGGATMEAKALRASRVRHLWEDFKCYVGLVDGSASPWLPDVPEGGAACSVAGGARAVSEGSVHGSISQSISRLWRTWGGIPIRVGAGWRGVGPRTSWRTEAGQEYPARPDQQRRPLRAWESALGVKNAERVQHQKGRMDSQVAQIPLRTSGDSVCRQDAKKLDIYGPDVCTDRGAISSPVGQTKRRVWDILNAGPRNSFTCEGLLVHNCGIAARPYRKSFSSHIQQLGRVMRSHPGKDKCVWLDHCGNVLRFYEDTEELFENGVQTLNDGAKDKAARKEPDEKEKSQLACGACGYMLAPHMTVCPGCGKERPKRSLVETVAGEMVVLGAQPESSLPAYLRDRGSVWRQLCTMGADRKGGDEKAANKWALAQYRNLYSEWPRGAFKPYGEPIDPRLAGKIRSNMIAWAKRAAA